MFIFKLPISVPFGSFPNLPIVIKTELPTKPGDKMKSTRILKWLPNMKTEREVATSNEKDRWILIWGYKEPNNATHIECIIKTDAHRNLQQEFRWTFKIKHYKL